MIITITGKPCSGKGVASKILCEKHGFDYLCAGDIMREIATQQGYKNVLEFQQQYSDIKEVDKFIDNKIAKIGEARSADNLVIDSRLAWHFVKNSFKVFIDVNIDVAVKRLINANRQNEKATTEIEARQLLTDRWQAENERYMELYNTNNLNMKNYNLVLDSSNLLPEQMADKIFVEYQKFLKNYKNT